VLASASQRRVAGLEAVLHEARGSGNVEVQGQTLDALARLAASRGNIGPARILLAEADTLAPLVTHLLDEADRYDADQARRSGAPVSHRRQR